MTLIALLILLALYAVCFKSTSIQTEPYNFAENDAQPETGGRKTDFQEYFAVQGCISQCLELDKVQKECKFNTNSGLAVGENCTQTYEPSRKDKAILCSYPLEPVITEFLSHPELSICDFITVESSLRFDKKSEKFLSTAMDTYLPGIVAAAKLAQLKVVLKIGSWDEKYDSVSGNTFQKITNNAQTRTDFIKKVGALVESYKIYGVLLFWIYPGCIHQAMCIPTSKVKDQERESDKIALFTKELKEQANLKTLMIHGSSLIHPNTLLTLGATFYRKLERTVDYFIFETFSSTAAGSAQTRHNLKAIKDLMTSFKKTVDDPAIWRKMVFCVTAELFSCILVDPKKSMIGAKISNKDSLIYMSYADICRKVKVENYTVKTNLELGQSFAYKDKDWFAFDDFKSMNELINFFKQFGAGGLMVESIAREADTNNCGCPRYFYLRMVGELFKGGDCIYTPCL